LNSLRTWWQRSVLIVVFGQQLQKLIRPRRNQLGELWIAGSDLL
jgi:hypothetical protein